MDTQMLFGETATVRARERGWLNVRAALDGYEGWVAEEATSTPVSPVNHRVGALRTYAFSEPDFKSAPAALLSMNAKLTLDDRHGRYRRAERLGWVVDDHVRPIDGHGDDPAAVAERFLGAPYLWGGKESLGLDCSGLVQTAFEACGRFLPRDSGPQSRAEGFEEVARRDMDRGDLVFWDGHVAIALDDRRIVHANATAMAVTIDRLDDFVARAFDEAGAVTAVRRLRSRRP